MRMTAVFACVPLLAAALGAQATTSAPIAGEGGQGVKVLLLPPAAHAPLRFVLSEPAYVAAFIVYPGAGVRLLYPTVDAPEQLHESGYNVEQLFGDSFDDDVYHVVLGPTFGGPSYLYVIASRNPLDVARYVHRPMTLATSVGVQASRSFYSDVAFDALLNNAISLGDDTSWDSDVYMLWPSQSPEGAAALNTLPQYSYLNCGDGSTRLVPSNYPFSGCQGQSRLRVNQLAVAQVQQSASAIASKQVQRAELTSAAQTQAPTVLPTIRGPHITDAERTAAIARENALHPLVFTAANGDAGVARAQAASDGQVQVLDASGGFRDRGRHDIDHARGDMYAAQRDARRERQDGGVQGSPRLSPNPHLSPNPGMAPAPHLESSRPSSSVGTTSVHVSSAPSQGNTAGGAHIQQ
jgi:hypothetical protein